MDRGALDHPLEACGRLRIGFGARQVSSRIGRLGQLVARSLPLLLLFTLQFILPGLKKNEKRALWPAMAIGCQSR